MKEIKSAEFIKGLTGPDKMLEGERHQIAFIGRSNVGKSSVINSLTANKKLAKISSFPGRTRELNLFLINDSFYIVDLPGYGYAKLPKKMVKDIQELINWYLFLSDYEQKKIFLIIDAKVGPTKDDLEIIQALKDHNKNFIIIINKIDKLKSSEKDKQFKKINSLIANHKSILYSAKKNIGVQNLLEEIL